MSDWRECKFGEISSKIGSGATPTGGENAYILEGISLIRSQNVYDFTFSSDGLAFIDDNQANELRNVEVLENDILINITGESVTRSCIVPKNYLPARVNQHVSIIRPIKEIADFRFVFYYIQSIKPELNSIAEIGCTRRALTKSMLEDIVVLLPPLPEQRAIASVLSSLDDKIDLLNRQNKTLEAMAETLFRKWFVEEENSKIGKITDVVEFNPKRQLPKGTIAPYLDMANISTSVFHPENWYDREFNSGTKFTNGDTLLARITPCLENGKSAYVTFLEKGQIGWGSTEFIVMHSKLNLHPIFTYALARNSDFRDYAEGCFEGTSGRQRVNVDHLANYEVNIPNESIIRQFNQTVSSIEPKLHANFMQIKTLTKLREALLPKLMSGEVKVS
jgi:type I restriction enzyme S subunit